MEIIYKSKYALVCELTGHNKPSTQEEENYCQQVEYETDTWKPVITDMLIKFIKEINDKKKPYIKGTFMERLLKLKS